MATVSCLVIVHMYIKLPYQSINDPYGPRQELVSKREGRKHFFTRTTSLLIYLGQVNFDVNDRDCFPALLNAG